MTVTNLWVFLHCNIIALIFIKPGSEAAEIKGECPGAIEVVLI